MLTTELCVARLKMDSGKQSETNSHPTYSWERSAHCSGYQHNQPDHEDLLVFGYSCKLFRDDERARFIDQGKHLIPWMAREDLLIDRFDVRGCLHDLEPYINVNLKEQLTEEDEQLEKMCEEERFRDMINQDVHEEELRRLQAALAGDGLYHEINYQYESNRTTGKVESSQNPEDSKICDEFADGNEDDFKLPAGLSPPDNIDLPTSQKLHNIMEKTALFVAEHGTQMEIVLKTKQSSNSTFDFLSFDCPLNPYYKYLISMIKSGKFVPKQNEETSEDSDDDGGHYLHPSLLGSTKNLARQNAESNLFQIPNLLKAADGHDSYSQLVKSLKGKFPEVENSADLSVDQTKNESNETLNNLTNEINVEKIEKLQQNVGWTSILPSPPPEVEMIIEKMAQYVARTGEDFEATIKKRNEERFGFLNPGHLYHAQYLKKKLHYLEENRKAQVEQIKNNNKKSSQQLKMVPVSFIISSKEGKSSDENKQNHLKNLNELDVLDENKKSNENDKLKDKLALAARERLSKEKQEERKRKAALFLSMIKSKEMKANNPKQSENQPEDTNVQESCSLEKSSPTATQKVSLPNNNCQEDSMTSKQLELIKGGSLLPFIVSDKPIKKNVSSHLPGRHHRHHKRSHHKKSRSRSRDRSSSHSPSHAKRKHKKSRSKSRSRSRSRSKSNRR